LKIGSLQTETIIIGFLESKKIGSLQVHIGYLTFSLKKTANSVGNLQQAELHRRKS